MINRSKLSHSGIITNYVCNAECRHCMYMSSPKCKKDFITEAVAESIVKTLAESGTRSVHIGGGEPFINFDALCNVLRALKKHGVWVDYIETNAFWCSDESIISKRLAAVKTLGVECVMASVDPFHIEFVPLARPLLLCKMLESLGMDYFIWQERYLHKLIKLDHGRAYGHDELKQIIGEDYVTETAKEYGLGINGRALTIAVDIYGKQPHEVILNQRTSCASLFSTSHCHIDLYGNVIPSGCPGISIELGDFIRFANGEKMTDETKYPVVSKLISGGLNELYKYAAALGFIPDESGYATPCALCVDIRAYLDKVKPSYDVAPDCFYN